MRRIGALPLLLGTFIMTAGAVVIGLVFASSPRSSSSSSRPRGCNRVLEPVIRLLAAVPSVVYGLIGILVLVPFVADTSSRESRKESVAYVVQLDGRRPGRSRPWSSP